LSVVVIRFDPQIKHWSFGDQEPGSGPAGHRRGTFTFVAIDEHGKPRVLSGVKLR
jgi:hypothetical protein